MSYMTSMTSYFPYNTTDDCINERVFWLIYLFMPQFCAAVNCSNLNN